MYELIRGKKANWKNIALFNFWGFFLISFRMQTAVFQLAMRNLPQKGGQPRICSPACFTAPRTLLLLLFRSLGTGIALGFISKTPALAECGAKPTKDSGNLCTDFSDRWIKCSKISALRASRETPEEHSSLLKKMEKLQICIFLCLFFLNTEYVLANIRCMIHNSFFFPSLFPCIRGKAKAHNESWTCRCNPAKRLAWEDIYACAESHWSQGAVGSAHTALFASANITTLFYSSCKFKIHPRNEYRQ